MSKKSILNKHAHPNPRMWKLKNRIHIRGCKKTDIWHIPNLQCKHAQYRSRNGHSIKIKKKVKGTLQSSYSGYSE